MGARLTLLGTALSQHPLIVGPRLRPGSHGNFVEVDVGASGGANVLAALLNTKSSKASTSGDGKVRVPWRARQFSCLREKVEGIEMTKSFRATRAPGCGPLA